MASDLLANRYQLDGVLGEGAMGRVSRVLDTLTGRPLALKAIAPRHAADARSRLMFQQEFRLMTHIRHPNCCRVFDYGVLADGSPYFTMEIVPGHGLDELLPLSPGRFAAVFEQLARALAYIHRLGYVHRDLKPANVRLTADHTVKLMDFGLMELAGRAGGTLAGTLPYVSPEMVRRGPIDQRSDLYALGALGYEMLTGRPPFVGATPGEVLRAHLQEAPDPPARHRPEIRPEHAALVMRLLAKEPLQRPQAAEDVMAALGVADLDRAAGGLLHSPTVGREAVVEELERPIAAVGRALPGGCVVLSGGAGLGKSRVLAELRPTAQLTEVAAAAGACVAHGAVPYGPIVAALRELMPALVRHAPAALAAHGAVLAGLLPELEAALGVTKAPALETPARDQVRLHGAIVGVLEALTATQGVVLLFDDWQWADASSRQVLGPLVRLAVAAPLAIVLATRDPGQPIPEGATTCALAPLDAAGVRALVSNTLGQTRLDEAFLAAVTGRSEGNPVVAERVLGYLVERGHLVRRDGAWDTAIAIPDDAPRSHEGAGRAILDRLGGDALAVARVGAVADGQLAVDVMAAASGLPAERVFDAIEALVRERLIVPSLDGDYHFAQPEFIAALYGRIPAEERRRLHGAVADAFERRLDPGASTQPLELVTAIARQRLRGPEAELAIHFALEAGLRHAGLRATATARELLDAGLSLVEGASAGPMASLRLAFLEALGDVERTLGELTTARGRYEAALAAERQAIDPVRRGRVLGSLAKVLQLSGDVDRSRVVLAEGIATSLAAGDEVGASRGLVASGLAHYLAGRGDEARSDAERALAVARACRDQGRIGAALALAGYLQATGAPAGREAGLGMLHDAIAIQERRGDLAELLTPASYLGSCQLHAGELLDAEATFGRMAATAEAIGALEEALTARFNLALVALGRGRLSAAIAIADGVSARARGASRFWEALAEAVAAEARYRAGDTQRAAVQAAQAVALADELGLAYAQAHVRVHVATVQLGLGCWDEALASVEALAGIVAAAGVSELASPAANLRAAALDRRGRSDEARAAMTEALATAKAQAAKLLEARATLGLAHLDLRAEAWARARDRARAAHAIADAMGASLLAAEAEGVLGACELAGGGSEALRWYAAMAARAEEAGAAEIAARACFGQAAAAPHAAGAPERLARARAHLERAASTLDEAARARFLAVPSRAAVVAGDYAAFGRARSAPKTGPLGFSSGLLGGAW